MEGCKKANGFPPHQFNVWKCGLSDGHNGLADPLPRNIETLNYYIIYCCTNYTWSVHVYTLMNVSPQ